MKLSNTRLIIGNVLFLLYNVLAFLFLQRIIPFEKTFSLVLVSISIITAIICETKITRVVFSVFAGLLFARLFNMLFLNEFSPVTWLYIINTFVILLFYRQINQRLVLSIWILYIVFIVIRLWETGNPNEIFVNSRNYVSLYAIILVAPYYLKGTDNGKISFWPALVTLIICILAIGRSGIIAAALLTIAVFGERFGKLRSLLVLGIFAFLIISLRINQSEYFVDLSRFSSLSSTLEDKGRSNISKEIIALPWTNYLFGFRPEAIPTVLRLGHLHSSWWNLSTAIGILPTAWVLLMFLSRALIAFVRKHYVLSAIITCVVLRISTDIGFLFSPFDYILFSIIAASGSDLKIYKRSRYVY